MLARFQDGGPALLERRCGRGTVLWFTSTCDRDWNDWPQSRLFLPMVHQMLGYLAGLADGGPVRYVSLGPAQLGPDAVPGVFDRGKYHDVVNMDPRESETDRCTPEEFAARLGFHLPGNGDRSPEVAMAGMTATKDLRPDEIWYQVLLVLFGVLLVEGFLANRTPA